MAKKTTNGANGASEGQPVEGGSKKAAKKQPTRRRRGKRATRKAAVAKKRGRPPGSTNKPGRRSRYTDQQRQQILATAEREGLTANQVKDRFGITPVTYYSWRKKSGASSTRRRGRPPGRQRAAISGGIGVSVDAIRQEVRRQVQAMLPEIVSSEIAAAFGDGGRGRRR